jgi:hypothetical protein
VNFSAREITTDLGNEVKDLRGLQVGTWYPDTTTCFDTWKDMGTYVRCPILPTGERV